MASGLPKTPRPIRWVCGECGGEMLPVSNDIAICNCFYCPQRDIAVTLNS